MATSGIMRIQHWQGFSTRGRTFSSFPDLRGYTCKGEENGNMFSEKRESQKFLEITHKITTEGIMFR